MPAMRSSRRTFLAVTAGAAAAPAISWAEPTAPPGPAAALKLGLASYSVRKFTLDQALDMCKEMALRYINLKDVHLPMTDSPEALLTARKKIEAAGLTIMGGGTITLKNDPAQVRKAFEYARQAGFPLMVAAPEPEAFDVIEKMIQEFGIKVAIHNHGPEDKSFPAPQDAMKKLAGRDKRFGLCMDIGHTSRTGTDIVHIPGRGGPGQDGRRVQGAPARPARQGPEGQDEQGQPDRGGQRRPGHPRPLPRPPQDRLHRPRGT